MGLQPELQARYDRLRGILQEMESVVVGFSGGVDSALLARVAHDVLGARALAVTAQSPSLPARELAEARRQASEVGLNHRVISTGEVANPAYAANPVNRCYFCKTELFTHMEALAAGLDYRWLAYGENLDDLGDHRPGAAAAAERGVRAPLKEAGLTKDDVRALARHLGLPVWDKPAFACLSSRFPHGTAITPERLAQVEACEDALWQLGFRQFRVRYHGEVARIEVDRAERARLLDLADEVGERCQAAGFRYVTMDLLGYRRGSLNQGQPALISPDLPVR